MKKLIITLCFISVCIQINAQKSTVQKDVSQNAEMNYALARMDVKDIQYQSLYQGALHVKIFKISDSKSTPENFSEGTDEFLESLYVSIAPDGDSYTKSKLLKIEGLMYPKVLQISESGFPKFNITIELGNKNERYSKIFELQGVSD